MEERDRHFKDTHAAPPVLFKCPFPSCNYESKRVSNCTQHMEKAHGLKYARSNEQYSSDDALGDGEGSVQELEETLNEMPIPRHPPSTSSVHSRSSTIDSRGKSTRAASGKTEAEFAALSLLVEAAYEGGIDNNGGDPLLANNGSTDYENSLVDANGFGLFGSPRQERDTIDEMLGVRAPYETPVEPQIIRPRRLHPLDVRIHEAEDSSSPSSPTSLRQHHHLTRTPSETRKYEELKREVGERERRDKAAQEAHETNLGEIKRLRRENFELLRGERRRSEWERRRLE